jgi:hypothetical protein
MKKIFARFLVLITLCMCLGALSTIGFAGNENARPGSCKPICVAEGVECYQRWDFKDRLCVISLCFSNSQNCLDPLTDY